MKYTQHCFMTQSFGKNKVQQNLMEPISVAATYDYFVKILTDAIVNS